MTAEQWMLALLFIHVVGFWALLLWVTRLRRQVRCLHFCFVGISDWGIDKLTEVLKYYWTEHGKEYSPFTEFEKEWKEKISFFRDLMRRARIRVPSDNHIHYILEDL